MADDILLTKGDAQIYLRAKYANRHGMVSGATGSGKTVSLTALPKGSGASAYPS